MPAGKRIGLRAPGGARWRCAAAGPWLLVDLPV